MSTQDQKLIDDAFYVKKERFLWRSTNKDGEGLVTALTEEACTVATRFYLKGLQDGWSEPAMIHEGTVGGKL